jgi:Concanavalin A-like lectin/glucanases superfamily
MATLPTRLVEIEFDAGTWTDVSAQVVDIATQRGRNKESGAFETGVMTVTLRNDTRRYDPDHTVGPYYGKLRPNRRVRFRATYNAITYPVFQGYIDRIAQVWGGPNDATAVIEVSDMFKRLKRVELPASAWQIEARADNPFHWWRLGEPVGATTVVDQMGRLNLTPTNVTFGEAGLITRDPDTAARFEATSARATGWETEALTSFTISAVVRITTLPTDVRTIFALNYNASNYAILSVIGTSGGVDAGKIEWAMEATGYSAVVILSSVSINDGSPHDIALNYNETGGTHTLYIDGIQRASGTGVVLLRPMNLTIGNQVSGTLGFPGVIDEVVVYAWPTPAPLSAARIAALSAVRATPWNGDLPGTRLGRILDLAAVPAADRTIDAGTTTLQSTSLGGDALTYAQKIEETEAGRLFVSADGKVTFVSRVNAVTGAYLTPQTTLVDADSGAGRGYRGADADVDEARIVTRATVSRDGSVAITVSDAAAQAEFGVLDETHDGLLHDSDAYSADYANWIVAAQKTPSTRVGAVELDLPSDPATMYPDILGLELGEQVTWKRRPQNFESVLSLAMRVEAISHATGPGYWHTSLLLSPFGLAAGVAPWILNRPGYSELGQTTRLGF